MDENLRRRGGRQAPTTIANMPAGDPKDLDIEVLLALVRAPQDGLVVLDSDGRYVYANPAACTMLGQVLDRLQGCDLLSCLGLDKPYGRDGLAAGAAGQPGRWEAVVRRPDGSELDILCTVTRLDGLSQELVVMLLQDDSERRRQAREAAALAQAAARVAVSDSIDATVQSFAESALGGTRALAAAVLLNDKDDIAVWIGAAGLLDGYAADLRAAIKEGYRPPALQETWLAGQRMLVDRDARWRVESDPKRACLTDVEGWKSIPWESAVYAPILYQGAVAGTLIALYREGELPSCGERAFLATLADHAAVAAMNARLMTAAREKVALEERQRLSRELHDSVSQALYGIALGARTARDLAEGDCARIVPTIDYVLQLAELGLAEMRALIFELRPESLETEGLVAALEKQVEAIRARHGIAARTTTGEEPDSSFEIKQALYRIAQEALQNTVKHARAGRIEVRLEAQDGQVSLAIEDDGVGFETDGSFPGHLGLRSMRERALGVGGSLEVASAPGHGTRIMVRVPPQPEAREGKG